MIRYTAGDILLAELPFTSEASRKIRPVLVMLDTGDEDVTVAPITTSSRTGAEMVLLMEFRAAGLLKPSKVRLHKTTTIHKGRTLAKLGSLSRGDFAKVAQKWRQLFTAWHLEH
ncbi:MAG: type II toxin-antitoxin system PemK/MazF family toxin [Acidobacteria bacterium]|nr:type II toxin-antitoxin system PemK/MazF family toxin [Acidobacteriota bacterium]